LPYQAYGNPYGTSGKPYTSPGGMGVNPYQAGPGNTGMGGSGSADRMINPATFLAAHGIPVEKGQLHWPLAFRLMREKEVEEMQQPLEAALEITALAALQGQPQPQILKEANNAVDQLRRWLRAREVRLPEAMTRDANAFLRRIEAALPKMSSNN